MKLTDIKEVYFIGVGGIGMSAVARYFQQAGVQVSGYDLTASDLTRQLEEEGIDIHYGKADTSLVPAPAPGLLVVYTPAVPADFAERRLVERGDYTVMKRSEILGVISRGTDCIAIAGTHGKTTTTTFTAHLMAEAGLEPNAFLGGISKNFATNFVEGASNWTVVEADEYDKSFLRLDPTVAVILSADPDHLDIYGDPTRMLDEGFRAFADRVLPGGKLLARREIADLFARREDVTFFTFGIGGGDYAAHNVRVHDGAFYFDLHEPGGNRITALRTALPGRHNVENAVAACAVTRLCGGDEVALRRGLTSFRGIERRFERVYDNGDLVIIDDYAHHPTELKAAIGAARELFPNKKIFGAFQPHLYSRTRDFADGFAEELDKLDVPVLIPIYPARELPIPGVTSELIYDKMRHPARRLLTDEQLESWAGQLSEGVMLLLGAGDIGVIIQRIVAHHRKEIRNA